MTSHRVAWSLILSTSQLAPRLRRAFSSDDPRAEGHVRHIAIEPECVRISRRYLGVAMRIAVPLEHYQGVVLSVEPDMNGVGFYRLSLAHPDPELSVILIESRDETMSAAAWRGWSLELGLPALVAGQKAAPRAKAAPAARRSSPATRRRGRFARRRQLGGADRMGQSFEGEREIIARN